MIETARAVAHAWFCDPMGHMNTRFYAAIFDDALFHLLGGVAPLPALTAARRGWADVSLAIRFEREVGLGANLVVRSGVARLGTKSLAVRHEMRSQDGAELHAMADVVTVLFDLDARRAVPIEGELRVRAGALLVAPAV